MNIIELNNKLKSRKIPQMLYSLNENEPTVDRMSLRQLGCGKYVVFFDTRSGKRLYEIVFETEHLACEYMLSAFDKNYLK